MTQGHISIWRRGSRSYLHF